MNRAWKQTGSDLVTQNQEKPNYSLPKYIKQQKDWAITYTCRLLKLSLTSYCLSHKYIFIRQLRQYTSLQLLETQKVDRPQSLHGRVARIPGVDDSCPEPRQTSGQTDAVYRQTETTQNLSHLVGNAHQTTVISCQRQAWSKTPQNNCHCKNCTGQHVEFLGFSVQNIHSLEDKTYQQKTQGFVPLPHSINNSAKVFSKCNTDGIQIW